MAKLYFRYSAMNAGKSTALMQVAYNYAEHGKATWIFTSGLDDRYGIGVIASRLGLQRRGFVYTPKTNFFTEIKEAENSDSISCILIDEAQFLTSEQVRQLHRAAHLLDIPIICYGIRSDFLGNSFPGSAMLLTLADSIEEIKNVCACGKKATMNVRIGADGLRVMNGEQIGIEASSDHTDEKHYCYTQACAHCFYTKNRFDLPDLADGPVDSPNASEISR